MLAPPKATLVATVAGGLIALVGTYWDEAWHTDIGRDAFASPPHLVLYAGVAIALAGVALWAAQTARAAGRRTLLADRPLLLAGLGGIVTLAAGPIDDAWHVLFGRDAVLCSPPHMLGIIGTLAIAAGVLAATIRTARPKLWVVLVGAGMLGAALGPVMEYESDVPQFAELWYLPVAVAGTVLAFALMERISPSPWLAIQVAAVYTGVPVLIVAVLAGLGHSAAFVPPIVLPALAFDATRTWRPAARAVAVTGAFAASYTPLMNLVYRGVRLGPTERALGVLLAAGLAWIVVRTVHGTDRAGVPTGSRGVTGALLALGLLAVPTPAFAHDPGQGELVAPGTIEVTAGVDHAEVVATVELDDCDGLTPVATVARRAGRTVTGPLETNAAAKGCVYADEVALDRPGRWFVYAELVDHHGHPVELWAPIVPPEHETDGSAVAVKHDWAYRPASADGRSIGQVTAGILLYAVVLGLLGLTVGTSPTVAARQVDERIRHR